MRVRQSDCLPFLSRPHIEKVNRLSRGHPIRKLAGFNLHRCVCFMAGDDMVDYLADIEILVTSADPCEIFIGTESTTAAAADVVLPKKGAFGSGKLYEQLAHGDIWVDG